MVKELVGPKFNQVDSTDAAGKEGPQEFVDTTRIDRNRGCLPLFDSDWSALCQTLYDGVDQEDGKPMYNKLRDVTKKVGIKNFLRAHERALDAEKKSAGETLFVENLKGHVKHRTQERKDLWEVLFSLQK